MTAPVSLGSSPANYAIPKGKIFVRRAADPAGIFSLVGDCSKATVTVTQEVAEHYGHQSGTGQKDAVVPTRIGVNVAFTLDELTLNNMSLYFLGTPTTYSQAAVTAATKTYDGVVAGNVLTLPVTDVTSVAVHDDSEGTPVPYVFGVNYDWTDAGSVIIKSIPSGASENAVITYSASAVSDPTRGSFQILQTPLAEIGIRIEGTNPFGPRYLFQAVRCYLKPASGWEAISDNEFGHVEFEGEILADPNLTFGSFGTITNLAPINSIAVAS